MKKSLILVTILLLTLTCKKDDNKEENNNLLALLFLFSSPSVTSCTVTLTNSTISVPAIEVSSTSKQLEFTSSGGSNYSVVYARNLTPGQKIVLSGSSTATAYSSSSTNCSFDIGITAGILTSTSGGSFFSQTSVDPPSFTVLKNTPGAGILVLANSGVTVTAKLE
ncbi:MAG: hypothetical protein GW938_01660 [Leptospira sp.]|nr:hypothetical protein [Leptospira sp.]NCS92475.1 hypothetical protein [Leptospira sp.]